MPLASIFAACLLLSSPVVQAREFIAQHLLAAQTGSQETSPQQAPAAEPSPSQQSSPQQSPSQQSPPPQSAHPESSTPAKAGTQTTTSSKKPHKKKAATPTTASTPTKRVVRNGSSDDPTAQLAPGESRNQASHQLQTMNQLLATTEVNLKKLSGRTLNASQQSVVTQIHQYMDQARQAAGDGDPQRADNLALKAHLLSEDLVKH
jgi:outer membrane biosynthesis protein TonB